MMMSRNALGNLINRYRAVLKKCRMLNMLGTLVLVGNCICGMPQAAIAADVMLKQENLYIFSNGNPPYDGQYDGNLTIDITATGNIGDLNYEIPREPGTGVALTGTGSLDVAQNLSISIIPEDWSGNKVEMSRRGIVIDPVIDKYTNLPRTMQVGGNVAIYVKNYKHSIDKDHLAEDEDFGLDSQKGIELSGAGSHLEIGGDLDITMLNGNRSMGVMVNEDAKLDIEGKTTITVKNASYYTYGIGTYYNDHYYGLNYRTNDGRLNFKGDLDIVTEGGNNSIGINLKDSTRNSADENSIIVDGHLTIHASGAEEYTTRTELQKFPNAVSNYGMYMYNISSSLFNTADIITIAEGDAESIGSYLYWYSNATFRGDVTYRTTADQGAVSISALARAGSKIDFQQGLIAYGGIVLNAAGNTYGDGSTILVNSSQNPDAVVQLTGNIVAGKTATADIFGSNYDTTVDADATVNTIAAHLLNDRSFFTGINEFGNKGSKINLTFKNGAHWNMTDSSPVSALTLNNSALVDLTYDNMNAASGFRTLTADSLDGDGGIFAVNTDIAADKTDQIIIGTASGAHRLLVKPSGAEPSREAMDSFIVRQERGNATFSLANKNGKVEHGIYFYELASRHGTTVAARSASLLDTEDSGLTEWYLRRAPGDEKSPTGETVLGLSGMASAYAMYMGQLSDLRERLGEIRYGNGTDGLWVRGFTQENRLSGLAGIDFSQNFYGTSFGYDHLVEQNENNKWLFGMRGQLTKADQRIDGLHDGSGDSRSYGLAAYATWQHSDGWYADTVLSWDWYDQNLKTRMMDGTRVHASYNTFAGGISQEFGRLFRFDNGLFVEPQLQLSWYWMKGTDFTTSNGMDVDQDDMYALTGRAGLVLGKKWDFDEERYFQPYIKGGVNHEFAGDQKVLVNGIEFTDDLRGTRGYYGAGFDLQFARNARFYAEFEREDGCKASTPWSVSAGLRVEF